MFNAGFIWKNNGLRVVSCNMAHWRSCTVGSLDPAARLLGDSNTQEAAMAAFAMASFAMASRQPMVAWHHDRCTWHPMAPLHHSMARCWPASHGASCHQADSCLPYYGGPWRHGVMSPWHHVTTAPSVTGMSSVDVLTRASHVGGEGERRHVRIHGSLGRRLEPTPTTIGH